MKRIVVGTDGSQTAQKAVEQAAELAAATGAEVHLVTAYRSPASVSLWPAAPRLRA
ncbi:MAG: universal stress protein [Acidimicrobiia bacterium]|nr:universal stress protein [Acidimicrobiia bacterium]